MKISAIIITKNEESNIKRCLESLQNVVDEVIVIDAFSTDKTEELCRSYDNLTFISRVWAGYGATKNYGNNIAQYPYILSLDADEVLSEKLGVEILKNKPILRGSYIMPRLNHFGQKAIRFSGWYPDAKIRLFPKQGAYWSDDLVHERLVYKGEITTLSSDLLHFTYSSFEQYDNKMRKYATLGARDMFLKQRNMSWRLMLLKVFFKFFSIYILKLGVYDGVEGLKIAFESSKSIYWKYSYLRKLNNEIMIGGTLASYNIHSKNK